MKYNVNKYNPNKQNKAISNDSIKSTHENNLTHLHKPCRVVLFVWHMFQLDIYQNNHALTLIEKRRWEKFKSLKCRLSA